MRICRVEIQNYRNFHALDVMLAAHAVIVGENKIGKTNFLRALRLVLDPSLPDTARFLRSDDFWDGLPRPLTREDRIRVSIDLTDFEGNPAHLALLGDFLVAADPMTSRLTYAFQPRPDLAQNPRRDSDYEFVIYGADDPQRPVRPELRRRMPLDILQALRDAESALAGFRSSPLRPLLDDVATNIDQGLLTTLAEDFFHASQRLTESPEVRGVVNEMNERLLSMVGAGQAVHVDLGVASADPLKLLRSLQVYIDGGRRVIGEASLGTANLLFIVLKQLELNLLVRTKSRDHTFLGIEEPEAHLHPHLQRLVYREFLRPREHLAAQAPAVQAGLQGAPAMRAAEEGGARDRGAPPMMKLMTTHSPHVVSVAPLSYFVLLRRRRDDGSTVAISTAQLTLDEAERADIERYIDVTRAEIVFAKGVLLVEGEAESYIVPALAKLDGIDCDQHGITVCPVGGVHFAAYLKFLGHQGLDIPYAVLTDRDPTEAGELGARRVANLFPLAAHPRYAEQAPPDPASADLAAVVARRGVFINNHTLEVDLFRAGQHTVMARCLKELTDSAACSVRADAWAADPGSLDPTRLVADISEIGKGRFAQRLSQYLLPDACPAYIRSAVQHVVGLCA